MIPNAPCEAGPASTPGGGSTTCGEKVITSVTEVGSCRMYDEHTLLVKRLLDYNPLD